MFSFTYLTKITAMFLDPIDNHCINKTKKMFYILYMKYVH